MKNSVYKIFKNKIPAQELFVRFKDDKFPFLLESSRDVMGMGRYSFFGSDPFLTVSVKNGSCSVAKNGPGVRAFKAPPLAFLRELLRTYTLKGEAAPRVPFLCGAVGFLSYDLGFSLEDIRRKNRPDAVVPDLMFGFYDCAVCVDHLKNKVMIFSSGFPERGPSRTKRAQSRLEEVLKKLKGGEGLCARPMPSGFGEPAKLSSNFLKSRYLDAVKRAKDYIACGDIYQVNLSQRFKTSLEIDDWVLYRRLIRNFPVSFSAFLKNEEFSIISASPERFLNFDGRTVTTRPMKGTRKRTGSPGPDRRFKKELIDSKKEKAELLMIVDLERNDLGRVCSYGSIKVKSLRQIEAYANVFQATAEIQGRLHKSKDRLDLIEACFPGGSVTGCPKIRAMEIIEELEPESRSIYTGSLGYLSFHNTLQMNVLIRSFLKKSEDISFSVGGGIVTDSKPEDEYEETLIKGRALMEALFKT